MLHTGWKSQLPRLHRTFESARIVVLQIADDQDSLYVQAVIACSDKRLENRVKRALWPCSTGFWD